jgi:uncharacterized membrane protein YheB (UPF0754 family)
MKWRELLSKDILKNNPKKELSKEDLDEAVQRILDRLIFIKNCQDRQIESNLLIMKLRIHEDKPKGMLYKQICDVFRYFDKEYNSKLFQEHLSEQLEIGNDVLRTIIQGLYHTPDRQIYYDFSAIDADVLGNIYEQYLGHILKRTPKRAR